MLPTSQCSPRAIAGPSDSQHPRRVNAEEHSIDQHLAPLLMPPSPELRGLPAMSHTAHGKHTAKSPRLGARLARRSRTSDVGSVESASSDSETDSLADRCVTTPPAVAATSPAAVDKDHGCSETSPPPCAVTTSSALAPGQLGSTSAKIDSARSVMVAFGKEEEATHNVNAKAEAAVEVAEAAEAKEEAEEQAAAETRAEAEMAAAAERLRLHLELDAELAKLLEEEKALDAEEVPHAHTAWTGC